MKLVIEASPQELLELGVSTAQELHAKILRSIANQGSQHVNPESAQDDYRRWYEEAMAASNEAGYAGMDAATTIRVMSDELTLAKENSVPMRTDAEIVAQTEELAAKLMSWRWGQEPEKAGMQFRDSDNTKAQGCWTAACKIQELITGADVENAVAEVDGVDPDLLDEEDIAAHLAHTPLASAPVVDQVHPEPSQHLEQTQQVGSHAAPRVAAGARRMTAVRAPVAGAQAQAEPRQAPSAQPQAAAKPVASASLRAAANTPATTAAGSGPIRRRVIGG